jgi:hypothetical protein
MKPIITLKYLTAVQPRLKNYLLSSPLFSPITFGVAPFKKPLPNIAVGNILLALNCLSDPNHVVEGNITSILENWQVATEEKAEKEITARIRQWSRLLNEWEKDPPTDDQYSYEIRIRVIVQLLIMNFSKYSNDEKLFSLDEKLRAWTSASNFIWENELATHFPESDYWYLYQKFT